MKTSLTDEPRPAPGWVNLAAAITRRMPLGKYRLIEALFKNSNQRFAAKMAQELGGYRFDCSCRDRVAREVFFAGCHAIQEIAYVRDTLRTGMTFIDVGANWGLFTLTAASLVGDSGRIVALEPDPRMFAKLKWNIEHNNLTRVTAFEVAAADCNAVLTLAGHDHATDDWETSMLVQSVPPERISFQVPARRLDTFLDEAGIKSVSLLKMDIEGAEHAALTGMEAGLRSQRYQRMLIELHPRQLADRGRTTSDVVNVLIGHGYKGYFLDNTLPALRRTYYHPWLHCSEFILSLERGFANQLRHTIWLSPNQPDLTCARN